MGKKKMEDARVLDAGTIQMVPVEQLEISPHNVRKVDINDLDGLAASIAEHGLLQPLVGYIVSDNAGALAMVCAGQRRLLAIRKAGITGDVPVRICDEATAVEFSLAENLERKDMNPADEVAAFKALVETGSHSAETIAKRFGLDLRHVRRRLKMAVLIPEILEALQAGKITVDAAEAYAAGDAETQARIFKAQNRPNIYKPHDADTIRREITNAGISDSGAVAKFIGGRKAYEAAGGTVISEEFADLFGEDDTRLRDFVVIQQLYEQAQAKADKKATKLALDKYPFVAGIEWADPFGPYGATMPKPPKGSGLKAVAPGWDAAAQESLQQADIVKRVKKAAEKHGATVIAIISLGQDGKPQLWEGRFLVGKDGWDKAASKKPASETATSRHDLTPEERARIQREHDIKGIARNLLGRSLIGETPGFGVVSVDLSRDYQNNYEPMLTIKLRAIDFDFSHLVEGEGYNMGFSNAALEPFLERATERYEELVAERQAAEAAAEAAAAEKAGESLALLEEIKLLPIDQWPWEVSITDDDGSTMLLVSRETGDDGQPVLQCQGGDGDYWETDNVLELVQQIRDGLTEHGGTLSVVREKPELVEPEQEQAEAEPMEAADADA